jgi:hypothetical protein
LVFGFGAANLSQIFNFLFYFSLFLPLIILTRFALAGFFFSSVGSQLWRNTAEAFFWSGPAVWVGFQLLPLFETSVIENVRLITLALYLACETGLFLLTRKLQIEKGTN